VFVIIGCLLAGLGLYSIAIGLLSRAVSLAIADGAGCWLLCRRRLALHLRWVGGEARQLWHLSVNVFVSRIATGLAMATDDFFIGVLIGPEAAGIFSITTRAHNMVRSLAGPFGDALMPSMAHLHGEGEHVRFAEVFATALKVQAAIAAIGLAGVAAFDRSFINLWVGPEIFAGNAVNITFSIWSIGYMVSGVIWQTLYSMGHIIKLCRIVWVETAVKVLASLSLIKATGILGAPVSALAAQAITMCMLLPLMIRTIEFARGDYFKLLKNIFFRLSLPAGIAVAVSLYAGSPQSWSHFVLTVGVYALLASSIFAFVDRKMIHLLPGKSKRSQIRPASV
jgi:O-antigen/teichoic acid export membrane protein